MKRAEIEASLRELGRKLHERGVTGEILIVGGAYMLLVLANREATRDIDAYFEKDKEVIRAVAAEVARERGLPGDWLNDAAKGFLRQQPGRTDLWASYPGLRIYTPDPEYIFAMKAEAARAGSSDIDDLKALVRMLRLRTAQQALAVVERYVPAQLRSMRTQLTLEAIFVDLADGGPAGAATWLPVRLRAMTSGVAQTAATHLAAPGSRQTFCGRSIPQPARAPARSGDPRVAVGAGLCSTCRRSWATGGGRRRSRRAT